jgi:hypothetical protein
MTRQWRTIYVVLRVFPQDDLVPHAVDFHPIQFITRPAAFPSCHLNGFAIVRLKQAIKFSICSLGSLLRSKSSAPQ